MLPRTKKPNLRRSPLKYSPQKSVPKPAFHNGESHIFLKYDGSSKVLKQNRMDAKRLGEWLTSVSDLFYDANMVLNGEDSTIDVQAQAGFIKGSFGIELIVIGKAVAPYLGLAAVGSAGGGLLAYLKKKGKAEPTEDDMVINNQTGKATVNLGNGNFEEIDADVAKLSLSPSVRKNFEQVVEKPFNIPGFDSFQVLQNADDQKPIATVTKAQAENFKAPPKVKKKELKDDTTTAKIEFVKSNKEKGTSGWTMIYNGEEVSVKLKDDAFMLEIQKANTPSIYGNRYNADIHYVEHELADGTHKTNYTITKIRGRA